MRLKKRRVRVHLKGDAPSVDGILVGMVDGHYLLKVARVVKSAEESVSLDGDLEIPRQNVLFVQRVGGEG